ncbi:hypothetical protein ACFU99_06225 [Streptomyces sp. NPDC057654]|uniref:hypothetical protein n=1 Tax=Streptomyces sp. NPDC057654 TaxID=3346196 RepID=UPI0036C021D1
MAKPTNHYTPYAQAYSNFLSETAEHQLIVLHDEGLYRHLRIQKPGTRTWSWDITTWPGHLATSGDIANGYMFTRDLDMIDWFSLCRKCRDYYSDGAPNIDVHYWAEKLCGGRSHEEEKYHPDIFLWHVGDSLSEHEELGDEAQHFFEQQIACLRKLHELRGQGEAMMQERLQAYWKDELSETELWVNNALSDGQFDKLDAEFDWFEVTGVPIPKQSPAERAVKIFDRARLYADSEREAHEWLRENSEIFGEDAWEWDLRAYDRHFLLTCYAIDLAVRFYREHQAQQAEAPEALPA